MERNIHRGIRDMAMHALVCLRLFGFSIGTALMEALVRQKVQLQS